MIRKLMIPDMIYHKFWERSINSSSYDEFYNNSIHTKEYKTLLKSGFDIKLLQDTLKSIYDITHSSISEIIDKYNIKTATLSHRLCIPVKTVEHWKYGDRECPAYMRFVILQAFDIKFLPENVCLESSMKTEYINSDDISIAGITKDAQTNGNKDMS